MKFNYRLLIIIAILIIYPIFINNVYAPPGPPGHGTPLDPGSLYLLMAGVVFGIGTYFVKNKKKK